VTRFAVQVDELFACNPVRSSEVAISWLSEFPEVLCGLARINMIRNIENATLPDCMQQGRHMLHLPVTTVARLREQLCSGFESNLPRLSIMRTVHEYSAPTQIQS
jgi:hypothetical protein